MVHFAFSNIVSTIRGKNFMLNIYKDCLVPLGHDGPTASMCQVAFLQALPVLGDSHTHSKL